MAARPLDSLLAIKAINVVDGLRPSDRRVGVAILEHFNRKTGRCDPGLTRLAELLSLSTRSVIRSTQALERAGLINKVRHGGFGQRNSYQPVWSRLAEVDAAWQSRLQKRARSATPALSPAVQQPSHLHDDSAVTQTYLTNLQNLTCAKGPPSKRLPSTLRLGIGRPGSIKPADAAWAAAERRWHDALHRQFAASPVSYGEIIELIDEPMQHAATQAEVRRSGDGLQHIVMSLKLNAGSSLRADRFSIDPTTEPAS